MVGVVVGKGNGKSNSFVVGDAVCYPCVQVLCECMCICEGDGGGAIESNSQLSTLNNRSR